MLELLTKKRQTLKSVYDMTAKLSGMIETIEEDESYETIIKLMLERKAAMEEIDGIDKLFNDALNNGTDDTAAIEDERAKIRELLEGIRDIDQKSAKRMEELRDKFSAGLRDISQGRKSISAYTPSPVVSEGFEFDTHQ